MLNRLRLALLALLLLAAGAAAWAQDVLPVPALSARVIDQTGTLTAEQRAALEAKLAAFEAEAGSQLVVLMVATTAPEDIASFAQRVGDSWKLGRREVGDGALIVVAKNDRRVWIATAKTLEGAIPDLAAKRVIDSAIVPAFRANDYARGLTLAIDQLTTLIRGEQLPAPQRDDRWAGTGEGGGFDLTTLAMFFFVAVPVLGAVLTGIFGRKLGSLATAGAAGGVGFWLSASIVLAVGVGLVALLLVGLFGVGAAGRTMTSGRRGGGVLPPIIWGGGGGGWGGGLGGGGGFGSGGGGNFGGGGAGGGW